MNEEGVWVHDGEQVQEVFINSFVKLYQTDQSACLGSRGGIRSGV